MRSALTFLSCTVLLASLTVSKTLSAQNRDDETLDAISSFVAEFCGEYWREGSGGSLRLDGEAEARLSGFFEYLTNLGIDGAANFDSSEYIGVLRTDLRDELRDIRQCRLTLWHDLNAGIGGTSSGDVPSSGSREPNWTELEGNSNRPPTESAEFTEKEDGTTTYANSPEGPFIDTDGNGDFVRIWVVERVPVEFPDRRGRRKAYIIAEERAKGRLVRYMGEKVTATRIVTEFLSDLSTARQTRGSETERFVREVDERDVIEALTEINTSFAVGDLRGLMLFGQGYDDALDEVWVRVGYSKRSLNGAVAAQRALSSDVPDTDAGSDTSQALRFQESETRTSPNEKR